MKVFLIFLFGICCNLHSQIDIIENSRLVLPTVDNYRTVIDRNEVTWICSENGLLRFNFQNSKRFRISDGLPTNDIWQLYNDSFNRMWLFHKENGIYFIRNDSIHKVKGTDSLRETFVVAELNDTIFFKQFGFFDQNRIGETYYFTKEGKFGKGKITDNKQFDFAGRRLTSKILRAGNRVYKDGKNNVFKNYLSFSYGNVITNDSPILLFENFSSQNYVQFISNESNEIKSIVEFYGKPLGRSIFFPNSKECILEFGNEIHFYKNIALKTRDHSIERILTPFYEKYGFDFNFSKDSFGNCWITVHRGSVHFIPKSYINISPLNYENKTNSVVTERNFVYLGCIHDCLFIFSRNSQIQEINLKTGEKITIGNAKELKDVKINGDNIAWSNNEGVLIYNVKSRRIKKVDLQQRVVSFDFFSDTSIFTNTGHKYELVSGKINSQKSIRGPIDHLAISENVIFTYSNKEIVIKNKNDLKLIYRSKQNNVINIERISKDQVAFFVENNGIIIFNSKGIRIGHFFPGVSVQAVFYVGENFLVITEEDILTVSIDKNGNLCRKNHRFRTYLGRINLRIQSAVVYNNSLILGLNNGIYTYQISDVVNNKVRAPKLSFAEVTTNKKKYRLHDRAFTYDEKDFQFNFLAYSYESFGNVTLNYKLSGLDEKWYTTNSQVISYKAIPPGNYTLSVYASSNGKSSQRINYNFSIPAPFWQRNIFLIFCGLLVVVGAIKLFQVIFKYRTKIYKRKNMLLELEFKALKAQLNPHFIFNSLNSLQTVMHRKSELEANDYIVSFSRLMRTLLDNSRVSSISLADELEFLRNFVFLSAQKINDPIKFKVDLGNIDDPKQVYIRNMILQPFIENSVLHGLANKDGEKWIKLDLHRDNDILIIAITDNGVGRVAAEINNKRNTNKHNSVSTTILKEKSKLLKEMHLEELKFSTIDLVENGLPIGTKVVVRMKIFKPNP